MPAQEVIITASTQVKISCNKSSTLLSSWGPLKEILGEFCHESFWIQTVHLSQGDSSSSSALPDMVCQLLAVDFDVALA